MKESTSASTPLRPDGERVLNAPFVEMDLNKFMEQIKNEVTWKSSNYNAITIFKSPALRIVLIGLHEGAVLKEHNTQGVISVQVLKGRIKFVTEKHSAILNAGQMISLQPLIAHHVEAQAESFFLLTIAALKNTKST